MRVRVAAELFGGMGVFVRHVDGVDVKMIVLTDGHGRSAAVVPAAEARRQQQ